MTLLENTKMLTPLRGIGDFYATALDTLLLIPRRPFAWREFFLQCWFIARVSIVPAVLLAIPFTVLAAFTLNVLLFDFGAADFAGTGAGISLAQLGPIVTVLVVAGAAATAICADLGARTIREELDALRVLGINPLQSLVVPRVLAGCVVAVLLSSIVSLATLVGSFAFSVYIQHVTPGAFVAGLTLLTGLKDVVVSLVKAGLFGFAASLIGCYKGISVGGGPAGVGNAVNETVVYSFVTLYVINLIITAVQFGGPR
ncbi:phospholipid/cholesterol/gamma-HCH transport system permease protein [Mycolicibacterium sp. BK556]|uniref:MlaE family ABC transporter permease n=1 Tax=Mycobacteriaceae TaxID=1762 RepID=UPI00105F6636|nr:MULTISPECIES: ABC transporter permease [Mycobacteriaceae]MBB3600381.1 phospholipid/cholesterol/gamma-HCH transport system permease protein [Mycolicibacterium sp. BK556]MBB3630133.1 phospholipid/cholesterol/gamma-HCH transport system permease protein [Mycolicibacterium sp. BK607]MBB3748131.1 phospholipid/cholesterol/gamma-HCH transport system permease protein [Mycolicibacterium sp. BK634]TDO09948.1 phospholipid/cholesterol/gamma-HCH transport system permease protein [Mycobacterium sp. BK086]